mgnify:CR=1 FL=1
MYEYSEGVSCVIAETFARIFYRNAINIGLPIIECPEAAQAIEAGDTVEVNFDTGVITDVTKGMCSQFCRIGRIQVPCRNDHVRIHIVPVFKNSPSRLRRQSTYRRWRRGF